MANSHLPEDPPTPDPVEAWVLLTKRWDLAYKAYVSARSAREDDEAASGIPNTGLQADEARELATLAEIKSEMDRLVTATRQQRSPLGETIVVGTISAGEGGPDDADRTSEPPSKP
ncbi:hypothetical protein [Mesorhizobium sp. ANAO-SY3R2]|uniref:hypothetical protein n=1 Tax=Mesorhizobium sp. ANAO-SY3R2 TaxID=3166644 RepID=UPI00366E9C4D